MITIMIRNTITIMTRNMITIMTRSITSTIMMMILIPTRNEVENQSFGSLTVLNSMLVWVFIIFNRIFQLLISNIQESFFYFTRLSFFNLWPLGLYNFILHGINV